MNANGASPRKLPWRSVMVFLFISALIVAGGVVYFEYDSRQVRAEKTADLESIAQLKVDQISNWLKERVGDGWALTLSPIFADAVQKMLAENDNRQLREKIIKRLSAFNRYMDYSNILLVDPDNKVILSAVPEKVSIGATTGEFLKRARAQKQVLFSDFYHCQECQTIHLDIFAPIINGDAARTVRAVLVLRIDVYKYLYPALQNWPILSATGETYLIQKQGDYAVFLNELRFKKDTALKLKIHSSQEDILATKALIAGQGIIEGYDYTGQYCLASVKKVYDNGWILVAKMSKKEIYGMIHRHAWYTSIISGILILATASIIGFLWYRQQKEFYQRQLLLEQEKRLLNQRYQFLTKYANDVIFLTDDSLNILDANEKASSAYGYAMDELLGMNVRELRLPEKLKDLDKDIQKVREHGGCLYETVHQRKNKEPFPVEISCRLLKIDEKEYYQAIIRDISERKRFETKIQEANQNLEAANQELTAADEELREQMAQLQDSRDELAESEKRYRSTFENTGTATVIIEPDTTISLANLEFEKLSGYARNEIEGRMKWTEFVWKPDLERMREYHGQRRQDPNAAPRRYEFRFIDRIGKIKDIFLTIDMIPGTGKSVASLLDITKKNAAEQQVKASLREKEVLLREIYHRVKNNLQVVSSLLSLQSGYVKDPRDKEIFVESQNRIRSMSLVHENLYKSPDLSKIDFNNYVRNLVSDLIRAYGILSDQLVVMIDINDISLGVDTAIPLGLMINEMVSNSLKHAFKKPPAKGNKWEVSVRLRLEEDTLYYLEVSDNGIGFADQSEPLSGPATLGLQLINTLAGQLDGRVTIEHDKGTKYVVEFRKT